MKTWRTWAVVLGAVVILAGLVLLRYAGNPMVLVLGVLMVITAAAEPIYGRANGVPGGDRWKSTGERFVDPETGKLVTVWSESATGERRYVDDGDPPPPTA